MFGVVAGQLDWGCELAQLGEAFGSSKISVLCDRANEPDEARHCTSMSGCHVFTNWMNAKLVSVSAAAAG